MGLVHKSTTPGMILEKSAIATQSDQAYFTAQTGQFNLQYPIDLDTNQEYGFNRVVFFINIVGNGKLSRAQDSGSATGSSTVVDYRNLATNLPANQLNRVSGANIKELIRGVAQTGANAANRIINNPNAIKIPTVLSPNRRLLSAISLYVPNSLGTSYGAQWSEEDLGNAAITDAFVGAGLKAWKALKEDGVAAGAGGVLVEGGSVLQSAIAAKVVSGSSYLQKAINMTPGNSKSEQLFRGVDFRTFRMDYQFSPKSKDEAKAVLDIIRMFRYHMLPEYYDDNSFLFIYPSQFDIKYFKGDKENEYLEKQMTAVLTSCDIDYTPNGQFNTFEEGMPSQINMSLTFKELGIPNKESSPFNRSGV